MSFLVLIYTFPEIASVGKTEEEVKAEGVEYETGYFPIRRQSVVQ